MVDDTDIFEPACDIEYGSRNPMDDTRNVTVQFQDSDNEQKPE